MPRFEACKPSSQKCVSSLNDAGYPAMEPLPFTCTADEAFAVARDVLNAYPRTTIEHEEGRWVSAICRTALLRFKDRVQLEVDEGAGVVHFKSYSTLAWARDDLGANRKRMDEIVGMMRDRLPAGS